MRLSAFVRLITAAGTVLIAAPVLAQTADLSVAISPTSSIAVGAAKTYTVTATNLGPSYIDQFTVNVTLAPPSGTYSGPIAIDTVSSICVPVTKGTPFPCVVKTAPMAVNAKVTVTFTATVPMPTPQPTLAADCPSAATFVTTTVDVPVNSISQLGTPVTDPFPGNNTVQIKPAIRQFTDLALSTLLAPAIVAEGGTVTYSQFVTNYGPCPATGPFVDFTPPASINFVSAAGCLNNGTFDKDAGCTLGTIAVGVSTPPYTATYKVITFPKEITGAAIPVSTDVIWDVDVRNIKGHNSLTSASTAVDLSNGHGGCSTGGAGTLLAGLVSLVALRLGRRRSS